MKFNFEKLKERVLNILSEQISPKLYYHNVDHTAGVVVNSERIALEEGITDERALLLLKVAALYHDIGFLYTYKNHEEKSCEFARKDLVGFDFSAEEMDKICSLIMATKIPQSPKCELEQVICDADLDYLGRQDFESISQNLKKEFLEYGILQSDTEWDEMQIAFLQSHEYFTASCRNDREVIKQKHLNQLKSQAGLITN
jgi:uncharacterized protein